MNRIFKTVWNALRRCLVVVNEATKSTAQATKVGTLVIGCSLISPALAQDTYWYDQYEDISFTTLTNFTFLESRGLKSFTVGVIDSSIGDIDMRSKLRPEGAGEDGVYTPDDYYQTIFKSKSITIGNMFLESGTFNIDGDINVIGKISNEDLKKAIEGDKNLFITLRFSKGALLLANAKTFEPAVVHGNVIASLFHVGGTTNELFDENSAFNGRVIVEGNVVADNMIVDHQYGFDTQSDNVTVYGTTTITNNLYNNGYFTGQKVIVNGTFYNGWGKFYNPADPDIEGQLPTDWVGAVIQELDSLHIVNESNLSVGTLTNTRNQTYTQTNGTIKVANNWFTNSTINLSGGIIDEAYLGQAHNLGVNNTYNVTGGVLKVGDLRGDSTIHLSYEGKLETQLDSVFENYDGVANADGLNTIGMTAAVPEDIRNTITDLFRVYVPGTVIENVMDRVTLSGGQIVISGVDLTTTQRDDLMAAFKETFFHNFQEDFSKSLAPLLRA